MSLYGKILRLGAPILLGQLGNIMVGFADTNMVGQYSTDALASASFVNNVFNLTIFACVGFSYGITPIVGALAGRNDSHRAGAILKTSLIANILFGILLSTLMGIVYAFIPQMGIPADIITPVRSYFLIYLAGLLPVVAFNLMAQWSYAIGRTVAPTVIILCFNAVNIFLNWVLIYGHLGSPELGLNGAGYATLVCRIGCMAAIAIYFMTGRGFASYREGFFKSHARRDDFKTINAKSWPVSLQMSLESGAFTVAAVMAGWLGKTELASYQIIVTLGTLGFCLYYSIGTAISVLVANEAGSGNIAGMRRTAGCGYRVMLAVATISCGVFICFGRDIVQFFSDDDAVRAMSLSLILPLVLYQYSDATQVTFANALRGTSNVMPMLWIAFVSYAIVGVPATYLLAFTVKLGIYGIVLSFSASLFTAAALFLRAFLRNLKRNSL